MERDPLRLVWRTAPALHALAALVLLVLGGLFLAGIDLIRVLLDEVAAGRAGTTPFLRLAIAVPDRISETPFVLFPGLLLDPEAHRRAAVASVLAVPVLIGLGLLLLDLISARVGTRVVGRIRATILELVLSARSAGREDAEAAASLAGVALSREGAVLGSAMIRVLQFSGVILLALLYLAAEDWRLALGTGGMLMIGAMLGLRRLKLRSAAARVHGAEGRTVEQSLTGVVSRWQALRAHGTTPFERDRLRHEWHRMGGAVLKAERRLGSADAAANAVLLLTPLAVLAAGAWLQTGSVGVLVASAAAAALAALCVRELTRLQRALDQAHPFLAEVARAVGTLQARDRRAKREPLPPTGAIVAKGVSAYDPGSGARIAGIDFALGFPAHVAIAGDAAEGPRVLAAVMGGQIEPSTGQLTYGGAELAAADPVERAHRIAFAGGETVLVPGSLRHNLLYGCTDSDAEEIERRLSESIVVAGLDSLVHARGLAGTVDPKRDPKLAGAIVDTRRAVHAALAADGLDRYVDPFDAGRYNHHATVGENLLFGKPVGDTFREDNLASHPFVRAILEAEELTKPLAAMGLSIAAAMVEMFAEIPPDHPLFERFSFFAASELGYVQDLVERRAERRRGDTAQDREQLIGFALRYSESRHRLGLLDDALRQRILVARADFAKMLPMSLQPSIEFYDQGRLCSAASVQDNLLFGRVAHDQAGAEEEVHRVIRSVLTARGLDREVARIGLERPLDPRGDDLSSSEIAAIDLVRCLVRRPAVLIVERALDGLPSDHANALVERLRRFLIGHGLVLVTPEVSLRMDSPPLDAILRFRRGSLALEDRRVPRAEPVSA
jgi:ABC-type transport system involved in cytochrome bd biosynthesis fused ATPase/permease subunit